MGNNTVQDNAGPEKSDKEKSLADLTALDTLIKESVRAHKTVAVLIIIACFGAAIAAGAGLTSPYMFPVIFGILFGNQMYVQRIRRKQDERDELKKTYESKFGTIGS